MEVIRISDAGTEKAVAAAARVIREGGIVAFPTETFYGLGVKYNNVDALKRLYEIKQRPKEKAMPLIIGSRQSLDLVARSVSSIEEELLARFWPGPLTILFTARKELSEYVSAETGNVAVRIPGRSFALDLIQTLPFPVTSTSANISGMPAADNPDDVIRYFGDQLDLLIDGGKTPGGAPSTIVAIRDSEIAIVRKGAIPAEKILNRENADTA